jgi:sulfonate transport system ATP-binding protein
VNDEPVDLKRHNIAYIFQENSAMPWLTVEQNVGFGLEVRGVSPKEKKDKVDEFLELVGLSDSRSYYPSQLSVSMLQRVSIARAFAVGPELLLMDEPYGQLDISLRFKLEDELIKLWQRTGTTVLFITHNIEESVYLGEQILVLTNKPTKVKKFIQNDLPRPRDIASPEFVRIRDEVTQLIKWW